MGEPIILNGHALRLGRTPLQSTCPTEMPWIVRHLMTSDEQADADGVSECVMECAICRVREDLTFPLPPEGDPIYEELRKTRKGLPAAVKMQATFCLKHIHDEQLKNLWTWEMPLLNMNAINRAPKANPQEVREIMTYRAEHGCDPPDYHPDGKYCTHIFFVREGKETIGYHFADREMKPGAEKEAELTEGREIWRAPFEWGIFRSHLAARGCPRAWLAPSERSEESP